MQEWYNCPKCDKDLLYGTNPCAYCKSLLAWSQQGPILYIPSIEESQQKLAKFSASVATSDPSLTPTNVSSNELSNERVIVTSVDTPGTLVNKLKKWQRNQIALSVGIVLIITACLFCIFVWIPDAKREGYSAGYAQAQKEYEAKATEVTTLMRSDYKDLERDYQGSERENQNLEQQGWSLQQQISSLQSQNSSLRSQNSSLRSQNSSLHSQISSLQNQNSSLQNQVFNLISRCSRY